MIDTLVELWFAAIVDVGISALVDVEVAVVTFALRGSELVVPLSYSYVVEALSGGWAKAVVDVSIDRRVGEWGDALTCV